MLSQKIGNKRKAVFLLLAVCILSSFFVPIYASAEWLTSYKRRIVITIDSDLVDEVLTDFPVMVFLNSSRLNRDYTNDDLSDLRFTSFSDGITEYSFELDYYNTTHIWAWVKIPSISNVTDTKFYLYFGYEGASSGEDAENVWDSNFVMVQHMNDATTSTILDSTSNGNNGTKESANNPIETTGKIGKGQEANGNDYIQFSACDLQGSHTISLWMNYPDTAIRGGIFSQKCSSYDLHLYSNGRIRYFITYQGAGTFLESSHTFDDGNDHYVVVTYDTVTKDLKMYVDNVLEASISHDYALPANEPNHYAFYRDLATPDYAIGLLDEIQVSSGVARSVAWVGASYETQRDNLLSYSAMEEQFASRGEFVAAALVASLILVPLLILIIFAARRKR